MLKPVEDMRLSLWADEHYYLSPESSGAFAKWRTFPYQRDILDALMSGEFTKISIKKSARTGATQMMMIAAARAVTKGDGNIMFAHPTIENSRVFSKDFVNTMLRDNPILQGRFARGKLIGSPKSETILKKSFDGGSLMLVGANSGTGMRMVTVKYLFADEVSGYPANIGAEGDQLKILEQRTLWHHDRVIVLVSTPTLDGECRISKAYEESDKGVCLVPCNSCGYYHSLEFENMRWPEGNPERAYFLCPECKKPIEQNDKFRVLDNCKWQHDESPKDIKHRGFYIWAAYSYAPNAGWGYIAKEYEEAKAAENAVVINNKVVNPMQAFTNLICGKEYAHELAGDDIGEVQYNKIKYNAEIPFDGIYLTCGVDVQQDRLELETVAWTPDETTYGIMYHVIHGNTAIVSGRQTQPDENNPWQQLSMFLQRKFRHESGLNIGISCTFIDSGYRTSQVETFARERIYMGVFAVKGLSTHTAPIAQYSEMKKARKIYRVNVGTFAAKELIYSRLKFNPGKPGSMYYPDDGRGYRQGYYDGLTSERLELTNTKYGIFRRFIHHRDAPPNEPLDCRVYATAAYYFSSPNMALLRAKIDRLQEKKHD